MPDPETADIVRSSLEAFAGGDRGAIRRTLGRDFFTHRPGAGAPGAAEVAGPLLDDVLAAYPDMTIRLLELSQGDDGVARGRAAITGTNTGGIWGAPPTGRTIALEVDFRVRPVDGGYAFTIDGMAAPAIVGLFRELGLINPADEMHLPPHHPDAIIPEPLLRLAWNGQLADKPCSHLDKVRVTQPNRTACDDCGPDEIFPTARMCVTCGYLGCCDTSLKKHARAHSQAAGHPLIRSLHGPERWMWCYEDGVLVGSETLDRLAAELGA